MADALSFETVRASALEALQGGSRGADGEPLLCALQDKHTDHVAVYCNGLEHIAALEELLLFGRWCDDVELSAQFDDSADVDRLFRYYSVTFLVIAECFMDLRALTRAADGPSEPRSVGAIVGEINRIWKHRDRGQGASAAFHHDHHHGPYYFADAGPSPTPPSTLAGAVPLVVPSLADTVRELVTWLDAIVGHLDNDAEARGKVEQRWSSIPLV